MTDESTGLLENFTETAGSLQLEVISARGKRRVFDVPRTYALIGRAPGCDIRLGHSDVSPQHLYLQIIGDRVFCIDLCSKAGTRWDDRAKVADWLLPGQDLAVGPYRMRLVGDGVQSSDDSMIVPSDFNPLAKYHDEAGSLPHVDIEFLNGSTDQPIWTLNRMITLVGRSPRCKICFETSGVSQIHCSLVLTSAGLWVVDMLGRGGTKVDGEQIRCVRVDEGGRLTVGNVRMRVRYEDASFPRNCDAFIEQAVASKIVTREQIEEVRSNSEEPLQTCRALTRRLIDEEILTPWQAQQIISDKKRPLILEDRFKLLARLGIGGMATVYRALDLKRDREVAIKFPNAKASARPISMRRFRREAIICSKLEHPNLVRALGVAQDGSFLVLEYIDGQDLRTLVSQNGPLEPATAVHYVIQVAEAMEFAYQSGVIHRDIKPANILVTHNQKVKILDLGLASLKGMKDLPAAETKELHEELTQFGVYVGTVRYMAPEQAKQNRRPDIRSDIYSLGCTLYELLSGASPFNAKDPATMIRLHHSQPIRPIFGLDETLWAIVQKVLAKDTESRYQSHMELANELKRWQQSSPENLPTFPDTDRPETVSSRSGRSKDIGRKSLRKKRSDKSGTRRNRKSTDSSSLPHHSERGQKSEIKRRDALRDEIAKLKSDRDALRGELSELQDQCQDLSEKSKTLDIESKDQESHIEAERVRLETDRRQLESEGADVNDRLTQLKAERDAWDSDKSKHEAEQALSSDEQIAQLGIEQQKLDAARRELDASNQGLEEQRDELDKDQKLLLEREESLANLTTEVEKKSLDLDESGKTFAEEQTSLHTSFEELRREQQRLGEERIAFEEARIRIQSDADRSSKAMDKLDHRRRKLASDRTKLRTEKERIKKFDKQFALLRGELDSKTIALESLRQELESEKARFQAETEQLRSETEQLRETHSSLEKEMTEAQQLQQKQFESQQATMRSEMSNLQEQLSKLREERSRFAEDLENLYRQFRPPNEG